MSRLSDLLHRAEARVGAALDPWIMFVSWRDLLFMSWPVPVSALRSLVPAELEIDTFDGSAWISIVPFNNAESHFRDLPALPGQANFAELNLRTYVKLASGPSVFFLSLDCTSAVADLIGRAFHLPFYRADMNVTFDGTTATYSSTRTEPNVAPAQLEASCTVSGTPSPAQPGSLAYFLSERLSLVVSINGVLHYGRIHHDPWLLQPAAVTIDVNTVGVPFGFDFTTPPIHTAFAPQTDTIIWPLTKDDRS